MDFTIQFQHSALSQLSSTCKHSDKVGLSEHVDFVKVYLIVHVISRHEIGLNRWQSPGFHIQSSLIVDT